MLSGKIELTDENRYWETTGDGCPSNGSDCTVTTNSSDNPVVTVVITTYNRPACLREAVETVSNQDYKPIELVVVDDCSRKPAAEVLADVTPNVASFTIRRHETNKGANAARNTGIESASGELIAFLDDDDRWEPEKLSKQVNAFQEAGEDVGLVYTGRKIVEGGRVLETSVPEPVEEDMTKELLCRNPIGTQSTVMVRSSVAKQVPFDEEIPRWADLEWFVGVSTVCELAVVEEPLVIYTRDANNRISDDYDKLRESYHRFHTKYKDLSAEYGWLFKRKMLGYTAFRAGKASINNRNYHEARRYFLKALLNYPFERRFYLYAAAALGGRVTHQTVRTTRDLFTKIASFTRWN